MYNEPTKTNEAMKKTMKKFLSMAALALVGAVMTGCSSDDSLTGKAQEPAVKNNVVTLTTTVSLGGDGTRALTDGGVKTFATGDKIAVIYKDTDGNTQKAVSEALTEGGSSSATFTVTLEAPKGGEPVRYIYPAAMAAETVETSTEVTADATINYAALASQDGTLDNLASKYDLAVFDGSLTAGATLPASSTLKNKLAILAYTIKDNAATPNDLTGYSTRVTVSDGPNTYGVTRTAADGPVYIAIRPTSSATISIMATTGTTTYTKSLAPKTYAANSIYKAGLKMTEVPDAIPGMFSTSSSGGKVYFSKGNLQYTKSTQTWSFMENQYSTVETTSQNVGTDYASQDVVSLFGWGTSGKTISNYGSAYQPYATSSTSTAYGPSGNYNLTGTYADGDWGVNMGSGWYTLSSGEWEYLFNTRTVNNGTGSGKSYTLGQKVNDVLGVVLYPDDYTGAVYSGSDWANFESAGCVFLPAAGGRNGASVNSVGSYGLYWSSTANGTDYAYLVRFGLGGMSPARTYDRYYGFSVRLVRPVESN